MYAAAELKVRDPGVVMFEPASMEALPTARLPAVTCPANVAFPEDALRAKMDPLSETSPYPATMNWLVLPKMPGTRLFWRAIDAPAATWPENTAFPWDAFVAYKSPFIEISPAGLTTNWVFVPRMPGTNVFCRDIWLPLHVSVPQVVVPVRDAFTSG
jgi:hypothetical protein